jgi:hypothetical protein
MDIFKRKQPAGKAAMEQELRGHYLNVCKQIRSRGVTINVHREACWAVWEDIRLLKAAPMDLNRKPVMAHWSPCPPAIIRAAEHYALPTKLSEVLRICG